MNKLNLFIFFICIIFISACNSESDITESDTSNTTFSQKSSGAQVSSVLGNPSRGYYDIVIVDIDRWEICLNYNRIRRNVTSFEGHLWYQCGRYIFEGEAAATYDPLLDQVTIVALDAGWDRGHIFYTLQFGEGSNDLEGTFCYYEFPRRTNRVTAWLDQGRIGEHDAGPYPGVAKKVSGSISNVHPKKARIENNED